MIGTAPILFAPPAPTGNDGGLVLLIVLLTFFSLFAFALWIEWRQK